MALASITTLLQQTSTPRISLIGGIHFLDLPLEIRLNIYSYLFKPSKVVLNAGNPASIQTSLIPSNVELRTWNTDQSPQLLRVCRAILQEARPILYEQTVFHIVTHSFAGALPSTLSNGHPIARHVRRLVWQMDCDILRRFSPEDFAFQPGELEMLKSVEIIARVGTWKGSFCGEACDREGFVRGRKAMLEHGKLLLGQLKQDGSQISEITEDERFLGKGEVRLLLRSK